VRPANERTVLTMGCDTYSVWVENICVARGMSIDYAVIFLKAIMQEYYNETTLAITIEREAEAALGGDGDE